MPPNSFNPLGNFNTSASIDQNALNAAKAFRSKLPAVPKGLLDRIYLHWAVEAYGCLDGQYNLEIDLEGGKWGMFLTHNPQDNAPGMDDAAMASHTWHRNTGAIGIAISGMDGAGEHDFGPDGVQVHELEYLCALAALACVTYEIDSQGTVQNGAVHSDNNGNSVNTRGEHNILTHGECAVIDAYPGERWDLGSLVALPNGVELTPAMRSACGDALRARIHEYAAALRG